MEKHLQKNQIHSQFLNLRESLYFWRSLSLVQNKRNNSEKIINIFEEFVLSFNRDKYKEYIDYILGESLKESRFPNFFESSDLIIDYLKEFNHESFKVLDIKQVSINNLKQSYIEQFIKYKNASDIYFLNKSFIQFHQIICHWEFNKSNYLYEEYYLYYNEGNNIDDYYLLILCKLIDIYTDIRAMDKAYNAFRRVMDYPHVSYQNKISLLLDPKILNTLIDKLVLFGYLNEAKEVFQIYKDSNYGANDFREDFMENLEKSFFSSRKKVLKISHIIQAKNALRLNIIDLSKYNDFEKKLLKEEEEKLSFSKNELLTPSKIEIPALNYVYNNASSLEKYPEKHRKFYYYWLENFNKDIFVDIQDNVAYILFYLSSIVEKFIKDKDITYLSLCFSKIEKAYGQNVNVSSVLKTSYADAYYYIEDYDRCFDLSINNPGFRVEDFYNIKIKCKDKSIKGQDILKICRSEIKLTDFGNKNKDKIIDIITTYLSEFHYNNGKNLVQYFCDKYNHSKVTEDEFSELKKLWEGKPDFDYYKDSFIQKPRVRDYSSLGYGYSQKTFFQKNIFEFIPNISISIDEKEGKEIPLFIEYSLINEINRIIRDSENKFRKQNGLPLIGEGWISETELFYKIKEEFPNEKIINHGKPKWLAPQHLDVYFPERNIGIEYQGEQHQRPIEYFGGEEAFKKNQERDKRKLELCKENNCLLIYVYKSYSLEEIKDKINNFIVNLK